ncbi:hypothetical protein BXY64_3422 [Marinifilum flexuosum]|uniref:Uncharacterized protein n=1 Tax=Marinifilum flexuosum TaxID=1117708 RepID=A0A419WSV9_9BACT|nr:hypothetical protein BXY64_3422 [Marinifilum flexuosum]
MDQDKQEKQKLDKILELNKPLAIAYSLKQEAISIN